MNTNEQIKRLLKPAAIRLNRFCQQRAMGEVKTAACDTKNLRRAHGFDTVRIFASEDNETSWLGARKNLEPFGIPDGTGGVNPGDRRALYYLIRGLQVLSVLEVGTHIGASTVHIALALSCGRSEPEKAADLTTVDIADVNHPTLKPWLKHGARYSPAELLSEVAVSGIVTFVTEPSLAYLCRCKRKFDLIFLDGDHSAKSVYQEIPAALKLLNPNGVILLHDYFPNSAPLWSDGSVILGPVLAVERLRKEGLNVVAKPLGKLPWETKLGSSITSLALLLRE